MTEIRMQDIICMASGEAYAETLLNVVKVMLKEYYPDIKLMRQILGVAEPGTPPCMNKAVTTDAE